MSTTSIAALVLLGLTFGCGGPQIPDHDGYQSPKSKPWKKPKLIKLDDSLEAEAEGSLSYPKRRRARWYAVETPVDGELTIKMDMTPIGDLQEVKLGFEVLDQSYKVLMRVEARDDDAERAKKAKKKANESGDEGDDDDDYDEGDDDDDDDDDVVDDSDAELLEWSRTLYELAAGKYYLHIWLNGRLDVADYSMRLKFAGASIDRETDFPAQVAFLNPLPVVPAFDDAPEVDCKQCSCKDSRCKSNCDKCKKSGPPRPNPCAKCDCTGSCKDTCKSKCGGPTAPPGTAVTARITRPVAAGSGTRITMNRGSSNGIQVGWRGAVVNKAGKGIDNGSFTVEKVSANECVGTVGASPDAVTAAGRARLTPP